MTEMTRPHNHIPIFSTFHDQDIVGLSFERVPNVQMGLEVTVCLIYPWQLILLAFAVVHRVSEEVPRSKEGLGLQKLSSLKSDDSSLVRSWFVEHLLESQTKSRFDSNYIRSIPLVSRSIQNSRGLLKMISSP